MRRYALVSGSVFALVTAAQVLRFMRQWPLRVGDVDVPVWASGVAALITASLSYWAFRSARSDSPPAA